MKPKILHIIDDRNIGGVASTINSLLNSRLCEQFEFTLADSEKALSTLQSKRSDVVISHNPCAWRRLLQLAKIKRYSNKVLIHEHHYSAGFETYNVSHPARFHLMLKSSYHLADQVIAISQAQEIWMQQNHLISLKKLTTIQQCRVLDQFLAVPVKTIQRPLVFAAYGRFSNQKGFDVLLQAIQLIPDINFQLYIGGYGEDEARLKHLAQGQNNVKFWGALQDVPGFLAAADVVVIPSRWEPWGNICVEAKAAGKPVIAFDIDGLSEQVQGCGVLVPPNDPWQLAYAIQKIANLPNQTLEVWRRVGRESVQTAWDDYLKNWESLLWRMINP